MSLNQPDPADFLRQVEALQDINAVIGGQLQGLQGVAEIMAEEFPNVSSSTCAAGMALFSELRKGMANAGFRLAALNGQAKFYLPEGLNEGDSPPCDC